MLEVIEWAASAGRIELENGSYVIVQHGDEVLIDIDDFSGAMIFIEHYPRVVH